MRVEDGWKSDATKQQTKIWHIDVLSDTRKRNRNLKSSVGTKERGRTMSGRRCLRISHIQTFKNDTKPLQYRFLRIDSHLHQTFAHTLHAHSSCLILALPVGELSTLESRKLDRNQIRSYLRNPDALATAREFDGTFCLNLLLQSLFPLLSLHECWFNISHKIFGSTTAKHKSKPRLT